MDMGKVMAEFSKRLSSLSFEENNTLDEYYDNYRVLEDEGFFNAPLGMTLEIPGKLDAVSYKKEYKNEILSRVFEGNSVEIAAEKKIDDGDKLSNKDIKNDSMNDLIFAA